MKAKFSIQILLLLFFFPHLVIAQYSNKQIDSLVNLAMEKFQVAGSAVAIVKDGKIVYEKGFGVRSKNSNIPVNVYTNFAIASNSKAFTITALALLVEEGKLNWTDKVVDHIPEFKMYNSYVTENFNIVDLLTHRSGMGLGIGDLMFFPDGSDFTIDDLLTNFQYFEPVSAFRTQFDYDNLLYLVAGELIARTTGMSWEEFIQQRILDPLEMYQSYPGLDYIKDKSNLASPHNNDNGDYKVLPDYQEMINGAAGGVYANVHDLSQWMLLHLNHGKYGENLEKSLFNEDSQTMMWTIHTVTRTNRNPRYNSHFAGYGLGWDLKDEKGNMVVSHTGGLPGMLSRTLLVPDMNLGIVVLTNTEPGGAGLFMAISRTLKDRYFGLDAFDWTTIYHNYFQRRAELGDTVTNEVWTKVEANKKMKHKIDEDAYIGVYKDNWFGNVEVFKKEDGNLWIKCHRSPKLMALCIFTMPIHLL